MMAQEQQSKGKRWVVQFLIKKWWGLSCLLLFIVSVVLALYPHQIPSGKYISTQAFLANYLEGAWCEISNPPESFEMVVSDGPSFRMERGTMRHDPNEAPSPYEVQKVSGGIRISMLDPNVSPQTAKQIWYHNAPVVELGDGFLRYRIFHDVPGRAVTGVYVVKGNTITEHHFIVRNAYFLGPAFLIIVIYLCGVAVRRTVRRIRGRRSSNKGT